MLSTVLLRSAVFDDLIARTKEAAPSGTVVTRSTRPDRQADVRHYHRPNLERRLLSPSVVTVHHDLYDSRGWLALDRFLPRYREASVIHCLNRTQQSILAGHGISSSFTIAHGVDRRLFPAPGHPRQLASRHLRLGFISHRYSSAVKGERFFEALLDHLDPGRISFVMVGQGRSREARLARRKGFETEHRAKLPYSSMPAIYRRIDALLITSDFEGGPATLPESLGIGVPVFSTPVGACPEYIRDGENGLLLTRRPDLDGSRIMALIDGDGHGMEALNRGAFASLSRIESWESVMRQWHELYLKASQAARS